MADNLNVSFLRGSQNKLNGLSSFQPGAFYLTTDTDRLYFAQSASELVYLNRYITTVESKDNLPQLSDVSVGDFYYVATGNILCTKATEDATKWTQINPPDTDTDTSVTGLEFTSAAKDSNIVVSYTLTQTNKNVINGTTSEPTEMTGTFVIKGSDIGSVVSNIALDTTVNVADNVATVTLEGTGVASDADGFTIAAGNNIKIKSDETNDVVIEATDTTYTFGSDANSTNIVLKNDLNGNTQTVSIVNGADNESLSVSGVDKDKIVVSHKTYEYTDSNIEAEQKPGNNESFTIISGLTVENGHVTKANTSTVKLPNISYNISSVSADAEGKLHIALSNAAGTSVTTSSDQNLYYKVNGAQIYNQAELTNYFYTKSEIDSTLQSANAMTFIGSIGDGGSKGTVLPTDDVKAGDTYIVVGNTAVTGKDEEGNTLTGHEGDMFIACGTEGSDGNLLVPAWVLVPAGDEIDTTYTFALEAGNGLVIKDHRGTAVATLGFSGGTAINVTTDGEVVISHANVERKDPEAASQTMSGGAKVNVVTGVTTNDQGHVTAVSTSELTMPAEVTYRIEGNSNNQALLKNQAGTTTGTITVNGGNKVNVTSVGTNDSATFTVEHNTLEVGSESNTANLEPKKTFTAVTGIEDDGYGHMSKITTTTYTLPKDTTYTLSGDVVNVTEENGIKTATSVTTLTDDAGNTSTATFTVSSSSLNLSATSNVLTAELTWGTF